MILIIASLLLSSGLILIGKNYTKIAFIVSVIFLSLVGLLFDPYLAQSHGVYTDLVRFFNELQLIRNYNLSDAITSSVDPFKSLYPGMVVNNVIMFLVAKTSNLHLLPFLSVLTFYSVLYIQLYSECKKNGLNKYKILLILLLIYALINITDPMCNIRNPLTSLIGVIVLYNNLVNNTSIVLTALGYILIFFIHPSSIIFPIVNVIVKMSNKWTKYLFTAIVFIFSVFSYQISSSLIGVIPGGSILSNVVTKLNSYSGGQADLVSYGTPFQKFLLWITALGAVFVLYLFNKETKNKFNKFGNACTFFITIFIATSVFSVHMFFRFGFILGIFILIMLPIALRNNIIESSSIDGNSTKIPVSYFNLYLLLGVIIILNFCWYFGTYAYRSINLGG